jgi:hypothetical protein
MHAVVVRVTIGDVEIARKGLREQIVPRASQAPGFVAGYWTSSETDTTDCRCSCSNQTRMLGEPPR